MCPLHILNSYEEVFCLQGLTGIDKLIYHCNTTEKQANKLNWSSVYLGLQFVCYLKRVSGDHNNQTENRQRQAKGKFVKEAKGSVLEI